LGNQGLFFGCIIEGRFYLPKFTSGPMG
jgi:hypothetical protein